MDFNRRWNENNVDLNRNVLTEEEWDYVLTKQKANHAGYFDFDSVINPSPGGVRGYYGAKGIYNVYAYSFMVAQLVYRGFYELLFGIGYDKFKKLVVSAQYVKPEGIWFGGIKLERSMEALRESLIRSRIISNKDTKDSMKKSKKQVLWIDLHTGLGNYGDYMLMQRPMGDNGKEDLEIVKRL